MSAVTFDTLKFVDTLEQAQLPRDQARAIAAAVQSSQQTADLATKTDLREYESALKSDLRELEHRIDTRFTRVEGDLALVRKDFDNLRWTVRLVLGGVIALLVRSFF